MVIKALFSGKNVGKESSRSTLGFHLILRRFSKAMVSLSQSQLSKGSPVSQKALCYPHITHSRWGAVVRSVPECKHSDWFPSTAAGTSVNYIPSIFARHILCRSLYLPFTQWQSQFLTCSWCSINGLIFSTERIG